jgi:hypothetical protein
VRRLLVPVLVASAILLAAAGFWLLRVHQRAGADAVRTAVLKGHPGSAVRCVETRSNDAAWVCGVAYRAESLCVTAKVSVFGSVSESAGRDRCARQPSLSSLPSDPTPADVRADVARVTGRPADGLGCLKLPGSRHRWACARQGQLASCQLVRVVAWRPLALSAGGGRCLRLPALRHLLS